MAVVSDIQVIATHGYVFFDESNLARLRLDPDRRRMHPVHSWSFGIGGARGSEALLEVPHIWVATWGASNNPKLQGDKIELAWALTRRYLGGEPPVYPFWPASSESAGHMSTHHSVYDPSQFTTPAERESFEYRLHTYEWHTNAAKGNVHRYLVDLSRYPGAGGQYQLQLNLFVYGNFFEIQGGFCHVPGPSSLTFHQEA